MRERPPTDHSPNYALALTQLRLVSQVSFWRSNKWEVIRPSTECWSGASVPDRGVANHPDISRQICSCEPQQMQNAEVWKRPLLQCNDAWICLGCQWKKAPTEGPNVRRDSWILLHIVLLRLVDAHGCIMPLLMHTLHALSRKQREGLPIAC